MEDQTKHAWTKYAWQRTVLDAFLSPPQETPIKVSIAERAIQDRMKELTNMDHPERAALEDARRMLQVLSGDTSLNGRNSVPADERKTA
jgi:hypothetical protein